MYNDYSVKASTLNTCEEEIKNATIKSDIQETSRLLYEMHSILQDFAKIVSGASSSEEKVQKDANCLWEEARVMTGLAYDNLHKLIAIKESII